MKCPIGQACSIAIHSPEYCFEQNYRDWTCCPIWSRVQYNIKQAFSVSLEKPNYTAYPNYMDDSD